MTRTLLVVAGTLSLGLGIIGIFVPILPTTPFLLLSAGCYAHGSKRLHDWLLSLPRLGAYIRRYREGLGIPLGTKLFSLALLWATIGFTVLVAAESAWLRVFLVVIAAGVTLHVLTRPTFKG
jgi:uncharacterized membrane protein YbaN (DUF454 family)